MNSSPIGPAQPVTSQTALERFALALEPAPHRLIREVTHGKQRHWLWTGSVQRSTGLPILHRYQGHKNVPVHRVLFALKVGPVEGRKLRRRPSCPDSLCVAPWCFEYAVPMRRGPLPEHLAYDRPPEDGIHKTNYKRYKTGWMMGLKEVYKWHDSERDYWVERCVDGHQILIPHCPANHRLWTVPDRPGKHYRCPECTRVLSGLLQIVRAQPRVGPRPVTAATVRLRGDVERWEATLPPPTEDYVSPEQREREMQAMYDDLDAASEEPDD